MLRIETETYILGDRGFRFKVGHDVAFKYKGSYYIGIIDSIDSVVGLNNTLIVLQSQRISVTGNRVGNVSRERVSVSLSIELLNLTAQDIDSIVKRLDDISVEAVNGAYEVGNLGILTVKACVDGIVE